VQKVPDEMSSK